MPACSAAIVQRISRSGKETGYAQSRKGMRWRGRSASTGQCRSRRAKPRALLCHGHSVIFQPHHTTPSQRLPTASLASYTPAQCSANQLLLSGEVLGFRSLPPSLPPSPGPALTHLPAGSKNPPASTTAFAQTRKATNCPSSRYRIYNLLTKSRHGLRQSPVPSLAQSHRGIRLHSSLMQIRQWTVRPRTPSSEQ